ncbi:hypothetical protein [Emticicia sp. 17c]|uniref:hypothetical protein n=1 Tax=Emticicia sp. 17c TaxID=3127704 RepID=UPI00301D89CC
MNKNYLPVKRIPLFLLLITIFNSCQKTESFQPCRLEKWVQENPLNKSFHYDNISLKDGRIEKMFSYDIDINKDTLNKVIVFFEYNQKGKVKAVRDESNPFRVKRFEGVYDNKDKLTGIIQKTDNNIEDEIVIDYDAQNRLVGVTSRYLLGINRNIDYDANGNPYSIFRGDVTSTPSISEYTFDDKRNFFSGIPEIQFYWIFRPQSSFVPFGDNNIVSTKLYLFDGKEFTEATNQRSKREISYNEKGYPETIKIIRENLSSTVTNISSFGYLCN